MPTVSALTTANANTSALILTLPNRSSAYHFLF